MELRVLRYFLAIVRENGISKAADALHVTQPTLSRQIMDLEDELGERLFERGRQGQGVVLSAAGKLLYERAADIVSLAEKTAQDVKSFGGEIFGEISIACAESKNMSFLADAMRALKKTHPHIRYHLYAGDSERVLEKLDNGLFDFAVIVENVDLHKYNCLTLPATDRWGVVLRRDSPLAEKAFVEPCDLLALPIMVSRQALSADLPKWFGDDVENLNVAVTLDLPYNGTVLVREGVGVLLSFEGLANTSEESDLCFRPLKPELKSEIHVVWRRRQQFSRAASVFLDELRRTIVRKGE